jgi:hypothetical protein
VPLAAVNFDGLREHLRAVPGFYVRQDELGVQGILSGGPSLPEGHAHLTISREQTDQEWAIEFEFYPHEHEHVLDDVRDLTSLPDLVRDWFLVHGPMEGLLGVSFTLRFQEWESAVPLPYAPAGLLDDIPGAPKIAGIDFAFSDASPSQRLQRAFVTTYESIDRMAVRLLMAHSIDWASDPSPMMIEAGREHLPVLVKRRVGRREATT